MGSDVTSPYEAVIVVLPALIPVTTPFSTLATPGWLEIHVQLFPAVGAVSASIVQIPPIPIVVELVGFKEIPVTSLFILTDTELVLAVN